MVTPNYAFQKRQRDLAKKQKKDAKKQKKAGTEQAKAGERDDPPPPAEPSGS